MLSAFKSQPRVTSAGPEFGLQIGSPDTTGSDAALPTPC